jgi:uncharacterized repeat protein (TIGR03803 family)
MKTRRALFILKLVLLASFQEQSANGYVLDGTTWPYGSSIIVMLDSSLDDFNKVHASQASLTIGASNWADVIDDALNNWNHQMNNVQFSSVHHNTFPPSIGDGINSTFFSATVFGDLWGENVLAITYSSQDSGNQKVERDVIFNANLQWDAYVGPLKSSPFSPLGKIFDLRRIALHEFGHVLGLGHPDQNGESVIAIMNSLVSDLDELQQDDIDGVQYLYGLDQKPLFGSNVILHVFNEQSVVNAPTPLDGSIPNNLVKGSDGRFYGSNSRAIFRITTDGIFTPIHFFSNISLQSFIVASDGNFYGTAIDAGNAATFFKVALDGSLSILGSLGTSGVLGIVQGADGNLYGVTARGGSYGLGSVFKIVTDGTSAGTVTTTIYSFGMGNVTTYNTPAPFNFVFGGYSDGWNPTSNLAAGSDGNLYGLTSAGGSYSGGVLYKISQAGAITYLHSFGGLVSANLGGTTGLIISSDGINAVSPFGSPGLLIKSDGSLYGVLPGGGLGSPTYQSGSVSAYDQGSHQTVSVPYFRDGAGTVFSLGSGGVFNMRYTFSVPPVYASYSLNTNPSDTSPFTNPALYVNSGGNFPTGTVILGSDGSIFGTTLFGGSNGMGTVYKIAPNGVLTTLAEFDALTAATINGKATYTNVSGAFPLAVVIGNDGIVYGITRYGGSGGSGTFFRLGGSTNGLSPIESWRSQWYGTTVNSGNAADSADPHHTGIPNLAAFALFGPSQNPALAKLSQLPQPQKSGTNYLMSFTQPAGVTGLTYSAEWSTTLQANDWHTIIDTGSGSSHVFIVPIALNTRLFMRLKVTSQ